MTGEIVNLRRARKDKARAEEADAAAQNRVKHGRTRAQRASDAAEARRRDQDAARLEKGRIEET